MPLNDIANLMAWLIFGPIFTAAFMVTIAAFIGIAKIEYESYQDLTVDDEEFKRRLEES